MGTTSIIKDSPDQVLTALREVIEKAGGPSAVARKLGATPATINHLFSRGSYLTRKMAERYASALNISADYLSSGIGDIYESSQDVDDLLSERDILIDELREEVSSLKEKIAARETTIATLVEMLHAAGVTVQQQ